MLVMGLDPGPRTTAWFLWDSEARSGLARGYHDNLEVLEMLERVKHDDRVSYAFEAVRSYGMPVGAEVFDMCIWMGRWIQALQPRHVELIPFNNVRAYLCRSAKAKDGNIRAALIEKFGPVGTKKQPGPFYGVSSHIWSAAAVAVAHAAFTAAEKGERE